MTTTENNAGKITTWFIGYPSTFATGYDAALCFTDKRARHMAIDTNPKSARKAQRKFAGFVNRLLKLVAREFPNAEIQIAGNNQSPEMRKKIGAMGECFSFSVWITEDNKIKRAFAIAGGGYGYESVLVEQTTYPHKGSSIEAGKTEIKVALTSKVAAVGARLIKATDFHAFLSE